MTRQNLHSNKDLCLSLKQKDRLKGLSWGRMNSLRSSGRSIGVLFSSAKQGDGLYTLTCVRRIKGAGPSCAPEPAPKIIPALLKAAGGPDPLRSK